MHNASVEEDRHNHLESGEDHPMKRLKQFTLNFLNVTLSSNQIRERIVADVFPTLASGNAISCNIVIEYLTRYFEATVNNKSNKSNWFCHGILVKKDLVDHAVQGGVSVIQIYMFVNDTNGYKYGLVQGTTNTLSFFCTECTGDSKTVR